MRTNTDPPVPLPLLLDLSHTSHTRARSGVQRVARSLRRALADRAEPVCFDPFEGAWRPLEGWENDNLGVEGLSPGRGAHWPLAARLRGRIRRWRRPAPLPAGAAHSGVLVPEIFSPSVAAALPSLFACAGGPRVALFHDAIALQLPEFTPAGTVARFPGYLRQLLAFDGVAAVSEDSRRSLVEYWSWLGVSRTPAVAAIPLGLDPAPAGGGAGPSGGGATVLCVGTIEARKNHVALLDACESLWARGARFRLRLVGISHAETGRPALERIGQLRAAGRPLVYDGPRPDAELEAAYRECAFTVYPSLAEGFGLPVAESLSRGKACACRMTGALGEIAAGGGCADIGAAGAPEIAAVIERLLGAPAELASLERAARGRSFRTWAAYTAELMDWMASLGRAT